jgi:hypothetical protein
LVLDLFSWRKEKKDKQACPGVAHTGRMYTGYVQVFLMLYSYDMFPE